MLMIMCKHRFREPMVIQELWKSHRNYDEYRGPPAEWNCVRASCRVSGSGVV